MRKGSEMNVYDVSEVHENVWAINELGDVTLYLVEGDEKALLIDTGYGAGEQIPACVGTFCKPKW